MSRSFVISVNKSSALRWLAGRVMGRSCLFERYHWKESPGGSDWPEIFQKTDRIPDDVSKPFSMHCCDLVPLVVLKDHLFQGRESVAIRISLPAFFPISFDDQIVVAHHQSNKHLALQ